MAERTEVVKLARYEVRPEAREGVEAAMHEFATYVREELPDGSWATFQEIDDPNRFVSLIVVDSPEADLRHQRAPGTRRFVEKLYPNVVGEVEFTEYRRLADSEDS